MRKIIYSFVVIFACIACSKSANTSGNNTTQVSIKNISGNFKGGTLTWSKVTGLPNNPVISNGTDPNLKFSVTYLSNEIARLTISTIAPITIKTYDLPLTIRQEDATSGVYTFSDSLPNTGGTASLTVEVFSTPLIQTTAVFNGGYLENGGLTEQFDGNGTRY